MALALRMPRSLRDSGRRARRRAQGKLRRRHLIDKSFAWRRSHRLAPLEVSYLKRARLRRPLADTLDAAAVSGQAYGKLRSTGEAWLKTVWREFVFTSSRA